jgi:hypothetical protein
MSVAIRPLALTSVACAVVVLLLTVLGGALTPGYSHLSMYISELGARGAPPMFRHGWVTVLANDQFRAGYHSALMNSIPLPSNSLRKASIDSRTDNPPGKAGGAASGLFTRAAYPWS